MAALRTPDFDAYPTQHIVARAEPDTHGVRVVWDDGAESRYHALWLRENSPDPDTTHPTTRETTLRIVDVPENLCVVDAAVAEGGDLIVHWSDGSAPGHFDRGWLRCHTHGLPDSNRYELPEVSPWDASIRANLPRFDGSSFPQDRTAFSGWLEAVHGYGFGILHSLPAAADTIDAVAEAIGPVRESNFGRLFEVRSKAEADSNAYTSLALPAHTDLATREYQPGLQMLFCIANGADGGESLLTDGFAVAGHLQANDPEVYEVLTRTNVEFKNIAQDTDYRWETPMIVAGDDGNPVEIRWTDWLRAPLRAAPETVDTFYSALRTADALMNDPAFQIELKLEPGELLCFDNRRVLHGRRAFEMRTGERWLRGCYIEREELHSRLRMLDRERRGAEMDA